MGLPIIVTPSWLESTAHVYCILISEKTNCCCLGLAVSDSRVKSHREIFTICKTSRPKLLFMPIESLTRRGRMLAWGGGRGVNIVPIKVIPEEGTLNHCLWKRNKKRVPDFWRITRYQNYLFLLSANTSGVITKTVWAGLAATLNWIEKLHSDHNICP